MIYSGLIKRILIIILTLSTALSLSACQNLSISQTQGTENPFSESVGDNEEVMFAYGFGLESPKYEEKIVYTGEPIEIEYYINNNGTTMSTGMLMFVDGIPQSYSIDGGKPNSTELYLLYEETNYRDYLVNGENHTLVILLKDGTLKYIRVACIKAAPLAMPVKFL